MEILIFLKKYGIFNIGKNKSRTNYYVVINFESVMELRIYVASIFKK